MPTKMTGKRGPAGKNTGPDLSFVQVDRVELAALLMEKLGSAANAKSKLQTFAALCDKDFPGQTISVRTAGNYIKKPPERCATWRFKRTRRTEVLQAIGFADKSEHPAIIGRIGTGQDKISADATQNGYRHDAVGLAGQLCLWVNGSEPRVVETDNLLDANGQRKAGPYGRVDVRIEHCEVRTLDNELYDQARNYIRISYPGDTGLGVSTPGVVNLMYVMSLGKFALVATIRPAVRKICVEAIRGFPDQWDKGIQVNGKPLSAAMFAALREATEEGGVMVVTDGQELALKHLSENYADTGKLADRVAFFLSSFESIGDPWKRAEPWQMGIALVDPVAFLEVCAKGGGKLSAHSFEYRSRFGLEQNNLYNPNSFLIDDMFTLLVGNLAIQKLVGPLGDNDFFRSLAEAVRARFKFKR